MEALFVAGDRKNSDLRVSVHFLFLRSLSASFFFSPVSPFDRARRKSNLFWKHYLWRFRRVEYLSASAGIGLAKRIMFKNLKIFRETDILYLLTAKCSMNTEIDVYVCSIYKYYKFHYGIY